MTKIEKREHSGGRLDFILLLVKVLASIRQNFHIGRAKLADFPRISYYYSNRVRTGGF